MPRKYNLTLLSDVEMTSQRRNRKYHVFMRKMGVLSWSLLVLVAVYLVPSTTAIHIPNAKFTQYWKPVQPWGGGDVMKNTQTEAYKNLWERTKRLLILHLKDIAEDYATKHGATLNKLRGFLYLNREFYRYHWRTIEQGLKYYMNFHLEEPKDGAAMEKYMDAYTLKMAQALKMDRVYAEALKKMPYVTYQRYFHAKRPIINIPIVNPADSGHG